MNELVPTKENRNPVLTLVLERKDKKGNITNIQKVYPIKNGRISYPSRLKSKIVEATISEGVEDIGNINTWYSSEYDGSANSKLPFGIFSFNSHDFRGCENLISVNLPESLEVIGDASFVECRKLKDVNLPENLKIIGDSAFSKCSSISSIDIPNSVVDIGFHAFSHCENLEDVNLPEKLSTIKFCTFKDCTKLKQVEFSDGLTEIQQRAFENCESLISIKLPEELVEIGECAFESCKKLKTVYLGSNLRDCPRRDYGPNHGLSASPFKYCNAIRTVYLPIDRKKFYEKYFYDFVNYKDIKEYGNENNGQLNNQIRENNELEFKTEQIDKNTSGRDEEVR